MNSHRHHCSLCFQVLEGLVYERLIREPAKKKEATNITQETLNSWHLGHMYCTISGQSTRNEKVEVIINIWNTFKNKLIKAGLMYNNFNAREVLLFQLRTE